MATLDTFTLVAGRYTSSSGIIYDGFIAGQESLPQTGTLNGSTSAYGVDSDWYNNNPKLWSMYHLDYYVDQVSLRLAAGSSIPANSGWADITTSTGFTYNRVDASYSTTNNPTFPNSARWVWTPNGNPFTNGQTYNVVVTDGVTSDTIPNQFSIGADITNSGADQYYYRSFTVSGINASTTFSANSTGTGSQTRISTDNSTWTTSITRTNGQTVYVRVKSSSSFNTTTTHTVSAGGVFDSLSITTSSGGTGSGTLIPLGITTGAIDLNTLRSFFGNPTYNSSTISMSDLYRGGNLVPDISQNSDVPTSGEIELADLYGAHTQLTIDKNPDVKQFFIPYGQPAGTAVLNWSMSTSPTGQGSVDTGYKALKFVCDYRWIFDVTDTSGNVPNLSVLEWGGVNYASQATSFPYTTPWHTGLSSLNVEYDYGVQTGSAAGTVRLEVRKIWNGVTYSAQSTAPFWEVVVENANE